jgi:hypothetical protein
LPWVWDRFLQDNFYHSKDEVARPSSDIGEQINNQRHEESRHNKGAAGSKWMQKETLWAGLIRE